jgi:hypothetical protein
MSPSAEDLRRRAARAQAQAAASPRAFYLSPLDALEEVVVILERTRCAWATEDDDVPDLVTAINILSDLIDC